MKGVRKAKPTAQVGEDTPEHKRVMHLVGLLAIVATGEDANAVYTAFACFLAETAAALDDARFEEFLGDLTALTWANRRAAQKAAGLAAPVN